MNLDQLLLVCSLWVRRQPWRNSRHKYMYDNFRICGSRF